MSLFEPFQLVFAPLPFQSLGRYVREGSKGTIIRKYPGLDKGTWLYDVSWEPNSVVLPAREDQLCTRREDS